MLIGSAFFLSFYKTSQQEQQQQQQQQQRRTTFKLKERDARVKNKYIWISKGVYLENWHVSRNQIRILALFVHWKENSRPAQLYSTYSTICKKRERECMFYLFVCSPVAQCVLHKKCLVACSVEKSRDVIVIRYSFYGNRQEATIGA